MYKEIILSLLVSFLLINISEIRAQPEEGTTLWQANEYFHKSFKQAAQRNVEQAKIFADSSLLLYTRIGDEAGISRYDYLIGALERVQGNYSESKQYFEKFLHAVTEQKDTGFLASVHFQLGIINEMLGDLDKAIVHQYASIGYYESQDNMDDASPGLNNLGSIYRKLKQYDKSEELYHRALEINQRIENSEGQATNYVNLGNLYAEQGLNTKAIDSYKKAVYFDSLDNFTYGLGYDYENIGNLFAKQENYSSALENHLKALNIRRAVPGKFELAVSYQKIGGLYTELNQLKTALLYLDSAATYADQAQVLEVQKDIALTRANVHEKMGDYRQAFLHQKAYNELQDSLLNKSITDQIAELNTQYETERKEKEIELLNAENEIAATKLRSSRRQTYGLLAGLAVFAGLLFIVFRLFSKTKLQNEVIKKALSEKDILIREIHHRVKNNLQFISSLLGLQTEHVADETALTALQEGQDRVQSMAIIHQNLYQEDNLTGVQIKDYFVKLIRHLFDSYNIRPGQIRLDLDIENLNLDVDTVIPIGLIVNELVSNALKYAFDDRKSGTIQVTLREVEDQLQLNVSDDGQGITAVEKAGLGTSFGYRLIQVFKDQLNADLEIDGSDGTTVNMLIRKYRKAA